MFFKHIKANNSDNSFHYEQYGEDVFVRLPTSTISYVNVRKCDCGTAPVFKEPEIAGYTQCWLQCPKCGKKTENAAGFYYSHEYTEKERRIRAIEMWNNRKMGK